jgi:hypothetical protein
VSLRRVILVYVAAASLALLVLWAFVSYLHPSFTGEHVTELLRCG